MKIVIEMTQAEMATFAKQFMTVVQADDTAVAGVKATQSTPLTLDEFVADTNPEEKKYTLKDVRAKLATLEAKNAKALITSYGVDKLTALPEEHYADIMQKAGEV